MTVHGETAVIKKFGGLTIAQDPSEAQFSVMPGAAIETNKVDFIQTLSEIQDFLLKIAIAENEKK
ncbi:MAG: chemotaxis protein CheB [Ferruginibacter sp.]